MKKYFLKLIAVVALVSALGFGVAHAAYTPLPITIGNATSLFSTELGGLWNSTATNSIILGTQAGDNDLGSTDSSIFMGELAGASDLSQTMNAPNASFIGNRAGYDAYNSEDSTFMGYLTGAYATNAPYSVFMGAQAGESATYAGNSFIFGQGAGQNATNASSSIFMGLLSGSGATNSAYSTFLGNQSGYGAATANDSTFIGGFAGASDPVDNHGSITYSSESHVFTPSINWTCSGGGPDSGSGVTLSDNGSNTLTVVNTSGICDVGATVTEEYSGYTMTVTAFSPSTSSILIGDHSTTGGGKNSVAIGAFASNAGYNNSICIGVSCLNTDNNQYAWGNQITKWRFAGTSFALPTVAPSGNGQFLEVSAGNNLSWGVPGAEGGLTVLAATTGALPFSPTYANGTLGVGATLTATSHGTLIVDGVTIPLNGRVLVKDEASQLTNGVYQESTLGDSGTDYVLTRTTDADTSSQFTDMVVSPSEGTQSSTAFGQQTPSPVIGTDNIIFSSLSSLYIRQQTSGTQVANQIPVYTGTGLTITKGTSDFQYDPTTKDLQLNASNGNNFVGAVTGDYPTMTGFANNFFGSGGGQQLTSASDDDGFGEGTGTSLTSGSGNNMMGTGAGQNAIGSSFNVIIGDNAGQSVINDGNNTLIGANANVTSTGTDGVAIGKSSLVYTDGVALGEGATNAGFSTSIALGFGATNTSADQFLLPSAYTHIRFNGLATYTNNAAAISAGLVAGDEYLVTDVVTGSKIVEVVQ